MTNPVFTVGVKRATLFLVGAVFLSSSAAAQSSRSIDEAAGPGNPFPVGSGVVTVDFNGTPLNLHYYKPGTYSGEQFIVVFHGASRTAMRYRDSSALMAERSHSLVVVPEFDLERFPNRTYQFGGVFREDGSVASPDEWTYAFVPLIVEYIRGREGDPDMTHFFLGFSAGGQFTGRMTAMQDSEAERIVVTSSGSCMFPTRDMRFPETSGGSTKPWTWPTRTSGTSIGAWSLPMGQATRRKTYSIIPRWKTPSSGIGGEEVGLMDGDAGRAKTPQEAAEEAIGYFQSQANEERAAKFQRYFKDPVNY